MQPTGANQNPFITTSDLDHGVNELHTLIEAGNVDAAARCAMFVARKAAQVLDDQPRLRRVLLTVATKLVAREGN